MVTATLVYVLPEDQYQYELALQSGRIISELEDLDNQLRSVHKYNDSWLCKEVEEWARTCSYESVSDLTEEELHSIVSQVAWIVRRKLPHLREEL